MDGYPGFGLPRFKQLPFAPDVLHRPGGGGSGCGPDLGLEILWA